MNFWASHLKLKTNFAKPFGHGVGEACTEVGPYSCLTKPSGYGRGEAVVTCSLGNSRAVRAIPRRGA